MKRDLLASLAVNASPLERAARDVLRYALDIVDMHLYDEGDDVPLPSSFHRYCKCSSRPSLGTSLFKGNRRYD
ncbi:hypothetical protein ACQKEF_21250 [Pseudomonas oryzihabitans]|uniref:hypothetical protein n=1 Tax=Pseudomonas oryzihabitans TaxID=47885 RepID=UPI003D03C6D5